MPGIHRRLPTTARRLLLAGSLCLAPLDRAEAADGGGKGHIHGRQAVCGACHAPTEPGTAPADMEWVTGTANGACQQCHRYEHHQVDLVPRRTAMPDGFPFQDGALACHTCHDIPACHGEEVDPRDQWFLRGGPYEQVGLFCGVCHVESLSERFSPHGTMDPREETQACAHCHLETPDRNASISDLRVISLEICIGCHSRDSHAGISAHRGVVDEQTAGRAKESGLPLADGDRMTCLTCHDPHPAGTLPSTEWRMEHVGQPLFPDAWVRGVLDPAMEERSRALGGALRPMDKEPDFMRLLVGDGQLCSACHDQADR